MSTWGIEAGIALLLFCVAFPLALAPLVYQHFKFHGCFSGWPALLTAMTWFYVCGVVAFTLFPLPETTAEFCSLREDISYWQLTPFVSFAKVGEVYPNVGFPGILGTTTFLVLLFNVVLTVPFGMLVAYRLKKGLGYAFVSGLVVSLAIEITQGTAVFGIFGCPYRLAEVDDLITNTTGAGLGWLLGRAMMPWLPKYERAEQPDLNPPELVRRGSALLLDVLILTIVTATVELAIALGVWDLFGREAFDTLWFIEIELIAGGLLPSLALFLLVPLIRHDRATPGQVCTWLANTGPDGKPIGRDAVVARFASRWLVWMVLVVIEPVYAFPTILAYETLSVVLRNDKRSLSAVVAGSWSTTRRSLVEVKGKRS